MSSRQSEVFNLPNAITVGRVFLIVPVLLLMQRGEPGSSLLALCLFVLAAVLDVVDGTLARRTGQVTFFGKFMDPLADKIMVMAVLVYLVANERLAAWVVVLILAREFYVSGIRMLALGERIEISAGPGGKAKTAVQMVGISVLLAASVWPNRLNLEFLGALLVYGSAVLSITSATTYTLGFVREVRSPRRGAGGNS